MLMRLKLFTMEEKNKTQSESEDSDIVKLIGLMRKRFIKNIIKQFIKESLIIK
jgi:hypothetical protein